MKRVVLALLQWVILAAIRLVLIVIGLPIVAIGLPFVQQAKSGSDGRDIEVLPKVLWLWSNDFDGMLGDKRGWWEEHCDRQVFFGVIPLLRRLGVPIAKLTADHYLSKWWWAAIRNPANNMRFVPGVSCPVSECDIWFAGDAVVDDNPGQGGWQFVEARRRGGVSRWFGFYFVKQLSPTRAFIVRLGYKVKPSHLDADEPPKGMTFKVNPFRKI